MARIDKLTNFLSDVATAIKDKTGKTDNITPANFDTEIASIETGGGSSTMTKGLVIDACDENGRVTDVSIVGMDSIPEYYIYYLFTKATNASKSNALKSPVNVHLPENVTLLKDYSFYENNNMISINLPNSITDIGEHAFENCPNLVIPSLPNGLTKIGYYSFKGCSKLALTSLPSNVTLIDTSAFEGCTDLALTSLPSGLTTIKWQAFTGCANLAITEIPSGVTTLDRLVFAECTNLNHITFLGDITSLATNGTYPTFRGNTNLSYVSFPNVTKVPNICSGEFRDSPIRLGTGYVYVPDNLVDSFKAATNWSTIADQIKPISELEASE